MATRAMFTAEIFVSCARATPARREIPKAIEAIGFMFIMNQMIGCGANTPFAPAAVFFHRGHKTSVERVSHFLSFRRLARNARNTHARPTAIPSPLNGERVRVRGENLPLHPNVSSAWVISLVSQAEHSRDARRAPASLPRWHHVRTARPSVANSKTVAFECYEISDIHRVLRPLLVPLEIRAGLHPVQDCNAPLHNRNRDSIRRLCAACGICKRKRVGHGELPKASSRPKWTFSVAREPKNWDSLLMELMTDPFQFKRLLSFSPLTLALSPLRGEGNALCVPGRTTWAPFC